MKENIEVDTSVFESTNHRPPSPLHSITGFFTGFFLLPRCLPVLLRSPRLLGWSIAIWITALTLTATGMLSLHSGGTQLLEELVRRLFGQPIPEIGAGLISALMSALLFIGALWFFNQLTFLAAIPLSDFLAEAAEAGCTPPLPAPPEPPRLRDRLRFIGLDAVKSVVAGLASLGAFVLSWIPGANLLSPVLLALALTFQLVSFPQTRRGHGFEAGLRFVGRNLPGSLGFGFAVLLAFSIPVVGALTLPLAIIGGTRLYAMGRETSS